jgi:L-ascorbate metabolism protein UlaG (beta-lactamase superfamily)
VEATEASHAGGRPPRRIQARALGYVVSSGSSRAYFAGDTDVFPGMRRLAPGLDVALLPIWGWGSSVGPGHLDPRRAAEALALLAPRIAVPIHWGTYAPLWRRPGADAGRALVDSFRRHAAELAPGVDVRVLGLGDTLDVD